MEIVNGTNKYIVGKLAAESEKYRLYLCLQEATGRQCLLQIALTAEFNGSLDRAGYILRALATRAREVEEEYAQVKENPKSVLNYHLGFPEVVDSFVCSEQGGRRINVLAFVCVDDVSTMVPLINITERDNLRVDLKTSAWITGKSLKLLAFAHSEGMAIHRLDGNNVLIEPKNHSVVLFDCSETQSFQGRVPGEIARDEIRKVMRSVIIALGGDPDSGQIPDSGEDGHAQYVNYLLRLSRGGESDAGKAHKEFYSLIEHLGWKGFHPFTTTTLND